MVLHEMSTNSNAYITAFGFWSERISSMLVGGPNLDSINIYYYGSSHNSPTIYTTKYILHYTLFIVNSIFIVKYKEKKTKHE